MSATSVYLSIIWRLFFTLKKPSIFIISGKYISGFYLFFFPIYQDWSSKGLFKIFTLKNKCKPFYFSDRIFHCR